MGVSIALPQPDRHEERVQKRRILFWKRIGIAAAIAVSLHLFFVLVLAPLMKLGASMYTPTEVVEISPEDLAKMKKQILKSNQLPPLLKQELREEFKSKEKPKDAKFIGAFNQVVPEETVAGPQRDAPQEGGGSKSKPTQSQAKPLKLSNLGLGTKLAPPPKEDPQEASGPQGPAQPFRPMGRIDKKLKQSNNNMLNAVESEYYSFFQRFIDPLTRNWYFLMNQRWNQIGSEIMSKHMNHLYSVIGATSITFDRSGTIVSIKSEQASGVTSFDQVSIDSVKMLGALPNPPPGLFEGKDTFTYTFSFEMILNEGSNYQVKVE